MIRSGSAVYVVCMQQQYVCMQYAVYVAKTFRIHIRKLQFRRTNREGLTKFVDKPFSHLTGNSRILGPKFILCLGRKKTQTKYLSSLPEGSSKSAQYKTNEALQQKTRGMRQSCIYFHRCQRVDNTIQVSRLTCA